MPIDPSANVGDLVVFKTKRGKWQEGWSVTEVRKNTYGATAEIVAAKGKSQKTLDLFGDSAIVYILPPKGEAPAYDDILEDYPNLLLVRRRCCANPTYMLLCTRCWATLDVEQTYTECSELELWNGRVVTSKPCIDDGYEKVHCDCKGNKGIYDIEFDPY